MIATTLLLSQAALLPLLMLCRRSCRDTVGNGAPSHNQVRALYRRHRRTTATLYLVPAALLLLSPLIRTPSWNRYPVLHGREGAGLFRSVDTPLDGTQSSAARVDSALPLHNDAPDPGLSIDHTRPERQIDLLRSDPLWPTLLELLSGTMLIGGLVVAAIRALRVHIYLTRLRKKSSSTSRRCDSRLTLVYSADVSVPFSHGVIWPCIYLPADLSDNERLLDMVIRHEKSHHRNRHLLHTMLETVYSHLFWFNPLVHGHAKDGYRLRELVADHDSVGDSESKRVQLAEAILHFSNRSAARTRVGVTAIGVRQRAITEVRVRTLLSDRMPAVRRMRALTEIGALLAVAVLTTLAAACVEPTAPVPAQSEPAPITTGVDQGSRSNPAPIALDDPNWIEIDNGGSEEFHIYTYGEQPWEVVSEDVKRLIAILPARAMFLRRVYLDTLEHGRRVFGTVNIQLSLDSLGHVSQADVTSDEINDDVFIGDIRGTVESWIFRELQDGIPLRIDFDARFGRVPRELNMSQYRRLQAEDESPVARRLLEVYDTFVDQPGARLAIHSEPMDRVSVWNDLVEYEPHSFVTVRLANFAGYMPIFDRSEELSHFRTGITYVRELLSAVESMDTEGTVILGIRFASTGNTSAVTLVDTDISDSDAVSAITNAAGILTFSQRVYRERREQWLEMFQRIDGVQVLPTEPDQPWQLEEHELYIAVQRFDWLAGDHKGLPANSYSSYWGATDLPVIVASY